MYGVPTDLPLQRFVGKELVQIALGPGDIQFHFDKAGSISVCGLWQLHDATGNLTDESVEDPAQREVYRIHVILGSDVSAFRIDAPRSFSLTFSNGYVLTIYDDDPHYEAFSIEPDGIYV